MKEYISATIMAYENGYAQGMNDALESIGRCKDCKYFKWGDYCTHEKMEHSKCRENDFCSYGETRSPEDEDEDEEED